MWGGKSESTGFAPAMIVLGLAGVFAAQLATAQATPPAVLNPSDPTLRMWLRADTLVAAGLTEGSPVKQWVDQSQYGTIMAPRTDSNPNGPIGGFPVEENPHLKYVTINDKSVPSVRFDVSGDADATGDPDIDGSGARDRLYQTNNLAPNFDPLDIYDGSSLTTFVVFKPDFTTTRNVNPPAHGWNAVFAKRGTNSSAHGLSIKNLTNFGNFVVVQYDGVEQYHSLTNPRPKENVWHTTAITIEDHPGAAGVDVLDILDDESESVDSKMSSLGVGLANGTPQNLIASRNPSVPEPFGIGGHSQNCCGELERFAGNIAELIIFARTLNAQEFADVENYLDVKYFASSPTGTPGDYSGNGIVDAADYTIWRDKLGQSTTLINVNPSAATPALVDQEDYNFWKSNFGNSGGAAVSNSAVPEPTTMGSLIVGIALVALVQFRSERCRAAVGLSWTRK